jgi:hypothetical protein
VQMGSGSTGQLAQASEPLSPPPVPGVPPLPPPDSSEEQLAAAPSSKNMEQERIPKARMNAPRL